MKCKIITILVTFSLTFMMFAGGNVTADDEIEQTDHDVYFICSDLGSDELD